jgi:hypothetical protein
MALWRLQKSKNAFMGRRFAVGFGPVGCGAEVRFSILIFLYERSSLLCFVFPLIILKLYGCSQGWNLIPFGNAEIDIHLYLNTTPQYNVTKLKQVFREIDSRQVTKIRARYSLNNFRNIDDLIHFWQVIIIILLLNLDNIHMAV